MDFELFAQLTRYCFLGLSITALVISGLIVQDRYLRRFVPVTAKILRIEHDSYRVNPLDNRYCLYINCQYTYADQTHELRHCIGIYDWKSEMEAKRGRIKNDTTFNIWVDPREPSRNFPRRSFDRKTMRFALTTCLGLAVWAFAALFVFRTPEFLLRQIGEFGLLTFGCGAWLSALIVDLVDLVPTIEQELPSTTRTQIRDRFDDFFTRWSDVKRDRM